MNEDTTPTIEPGAAGAPEGAVAEPTTDDVQAMYDELGIKRPAPTGKSKGRPKATDVRAKNVPKKAAGNTDAGDAEDDDDKSKSKDAPASSKDGDSGDDTDKKGAKKRSDSTEVSDESEETDAGVRKAKPRTEDDSKRGGEEDAEPGDRPAGQEEDESEPSEEEGKRPGKSDPRIERRFQKLTSEVREREQRIEELQQQLEEATRQRQEQEIAQEDPEYTIEDFRKVRDEEGNVHDLTPEQAELYWRRWKDGFEQRKAEREAEYTRQQAIQQYQQEATEKIMRSSVEAYDTLTGILDSYPELRVDSGQFDQEFSDDVMAIIEETTIYQPGTEPGNEEGLRPVILGFKLNPQRVLDIIDRVRKQKRSLPLNGVNDNVDVRSNVNVTHSRSSDPTVKAANELYRELGINKQL